MKDKRRGSKVIFFFRTSKPPLGAQVNVTHYVCDKTAYTRGQLWY